MAGMSSLDITCQSDGTWTNPPMHCVVSRCDQPPVIRGATIEQVTETTNAMGILNQTVTYRCANGTWISDGLRKVSTDS